MLEIVITEPINHDGTRKNIIMDIAAMVVTNVFTKITIPVWSCDVPECTNRATHKTVWCWPNKVTHVCDSCMEKATEEAETEPRFAH